MGRRAPRRAGSQGVSRRSRSARLAQNQRVARHARQRAHPAALDVHRSAPRRARAVARGRTPRARSRDFEMVEGGAPRRVPRLQPERQRSHHVLGLFGAPAARCPRLRAARVERSCPTAIPPTSRCSPCRQRFAKAGDPHAGMDDDRRVARKTAGTRGHATKRPVSATRRGRRISARWKAKRRAWLPHAPKKSPREKMPLITIANSPTTRSRSAGLERWKAEHPEAAALLAEDDVLVDSMRGRSSTWTRIRVNLRHVPEAIRPPQETPDPDDDPTREWRAKFKSARSKKSRMSSCGGTTSSCA